MADSFYGRNRNSSNPAARTAAGPKAGSNATRKTPLLGGGRALKPIGKKGGKGAGKGGGQRRDGKGRFA